MDVLVFGCSGHAKVIAEILDASKDFSVRGFVDRTLSNATFLNRPLYSDNNWLEAKVESGIVAVGDNRLRERVVRNILAACPNFRFITAIHNKAIISPSAEIGVGSAVMAGVVVNAEAIVSEHVILNTSCSVDHECVVGSYCSISPGAILGGRARVGDFATVSLGAKISHNVSIGEGTTIGAGAVVLTDIVANAFAVGCPARVKRSL